MYSIVISKDAAKFYKKCDQKTKLSLNMCFEELKSNPTNGVNIKQLRGDLEGLHRYRIRSVRVIYDIQIETAAVQIIAIGNRGDVYK